MAETLAGLLNEVLIARNMIAMENISDATCTVIAKHLREPQLEPSAPAEAKRLQDNLIAELTTLPVPSQGRIYSSEQRLALSEALKKVVTDSGHGETAGSIQPMSLKEFGGCLQVISHAWYSIGSMQQQDYSALADMVDTCQKAVSEIQQEGNAYAETLEQIKTGLKAGQKVAMLDLSHIREDIESGKPAPTNIVRKQPVTAQQDHPPHGPGDTTQSGPVIAPPGERLEQVRTRGAERRAKEARKTKAGDPDTTAPNVTLHQIVPRPETGIDPDTTPQR